MKNRLILILAIVAVLLSGSMVSAENYVNFKGQFYFEIPEGWDKVDYRVVDYYLSYSDTSKEIFNYEVVYAPSSSERYLDDAYVVVTFDSLGALSRAESDSILTAIASGYSRDLLDAPIVQTMSGLVAGKPKINRSERVVSVIVDMAHRPESKKKLWQYMRLNDVGLVSLYFYAPEAVFESRRPVFEKIVKTLSFENLRQAAAVDSAVYTEVGRGSESSNEAIDWGGGEGSIWSGSSSRYLLIAVIVIVIFGLIWNFVIRRRKK